MANLLGFNIFNGTMEEYMFTLKERLNNGKKITVISGNPEILYTALNNEEIANECRAGDIIPDGIGVILGGRILGQSFKEKIAGIEVVINLLSLSALEGYKVYMLGAEESIIEEAAKKAKNQFGANIVGYHNGFFDLQNCNEIINDINKSGAEILFVAMGCPRQERFIAKYRESLNCKIFMGVGGSFDVIAGKVKRAPQWMIKLGLEWLYRVIKEPLRIGRLSSIPKFLIRVILYKAE